MFDNPRFTRDHRDSSLAVDQVPMGRRYRDHPAPLVGWYSLTDYGLTPEDVVRGSLRKFELLGNAVEKTSTAARLELDILGKRPWS